MRLTKKSPKIDEELGKKDDDHWRAREQPKLPRLPSWRGPRRRRMLIVIVSIYLLYTLFSKISLRPLSTIEPCDTRSEQIQPEGNTPGDAILSPEDIEVEAPFNGAVSFPGLAKTLYTLKKSLGKKGDNNHVLFVAASLTSISQLIPLACDMASKEVNLVHFAIMGRHDISIQSLLDVNGVIAMDCPVYWHDARPDFGHPSSEARMEKSVRGGLGHLKKFIKPQVVITNNDQRDEGFLWNAIRQHAPWLGLPHIGLSRAAADMGWFADLDTDSLKAWDSFQIEILIQAPSRSSGSLFRLLKSLEKADYFGPTPSLTIELPPNTDPVFLKYLENWSWPQNSPNGKLTLRRRIQSHSLTPEEAAVRTIEGFYPQNPSSSHVLLLSPQTELSPSYFHYLQYTILKYKYSAKTEQDSENLLGISLELPSSGPSNNDPSMPPSVPLTDSLGEQGLTGETPLALWQAPNSNAVLYFGEKWAELHNFMANHNIARRKYGLSSQRSGIISKKYPAFMEYLLQLTRARGYYILYPLFSAGTGISLATVHNELYQIPDEYAPEGAPTEGQNQEILQDTLNPLSESDSLERTLHSSWTLSGLFGDFSGHLPDLSSIPVLSYTGKQEEDIARASEEYATMFSEEFGRCGPPDVRDKVLPFKTDDLFCLDRQDEGESAV